jgi:hypothetical protein
LGGLIIYISWKGVGQAYQIERLMFKDMGGDIKPFEVPAVNILVDFLRASIALIFIVSVCLLSLFFEYPGVLFRNKRGEK